MDTGSLIWFAAGWFFGGFVNGITGFGAAMAAMPFVLVGMDLKIAVPACSLMVMVASLEQFYRYHDFTDWKRLRPLIIGAVPGALAGALALRFLPPLYLKGFLGTFLAAYACWGLFLEGSRPTVISAVWGYAAGFFSTMFGTAFSFNGPPLAVFTTLSGWNKEASKAGLAVAFVISCTLMILSQLLAGMHSLTTFAALIAGTPCSIFGAFIGFRATKRLGDMAYRRLLFMFIGATGLKFLYDVIL